MRSGLTTSEMAAGVKTLEKAFSDLCRGSNQQEEVKMVNLKAHLDLLGKKVTDRVTGFAGVVTSLNFDLYGCIQATVHPGLDKDRKTLESQWFDVSRLQVVSSKPVMEVPEFDWSPENVSAGRKGPAEKPPLGKA